MSAPSRLLYLDHAEEEVPQRRGTAPRVFVVYPGHRFSTRDVADGVVNGLRAAGAEVYAFHYHEYIDALLPLEEQWIAAGLPAEQATARVLDLASYAAFPRMLAFHPDLVLWVTGYVFPMAGAVLVGQYTRTALLCTESPYQWETESRLATGFNWVFTNERTCVARFREVRERYHHPHPERVAYLPHGFDPERHRPLRREDVPEKYHSDVCFVGSPFPERQTLLRGVDWTGIDFRARGVFVEAPIAEEVLDPERGFVDNDEAHRYYAGARIVINHHRRVRYYGLDETIAVGEAESLNPRVYELAAAGVFQVCDDSRRELGELFGESIPTYRHDSSADLERVLRYWLARPEERAELAAEARRRVQPHTLAARMGVLLGQVLGGRWTNVSSG